MVGACGGGGGVAAGVAVGVIALAGTVVTDVTSTGGELLIGSLAGSAALLAGTGGNSNLSGICLIGGGGTDGFGGGSISMGSGSVLLASSCTGTGGGTTGAATGGLISSGLVAPVTTAMAVAFELTSCTATTVGVGGDTVVVVTVGCA